MGVGRGTGVDKKGIVSKAVRGVAIGLLVTAMAACSTGGGGVDPNVSLQKALADYFAGNIPLATKEFKQVVKTDPNNYYAWYNLGVIAQGAGDKSGAGKDYLKSLTISPTFESALYNYGVLKYQANDMTTAVTYLGKATVANPKDANAHWNLGLALAQQDTKAGNIRAKNELNKALRLQPSLINSLGLTPRTPAGGTGVVGGTGPKAGGVKANTSTTSKRATP